MDNGFYWVICEEVDDQPLVAEWCDGEWYLPGFAEAFQPGQIKIISSKIELGQIGFKTH